MSEPSVLMRQWSAHMGPQLAAATEPNDLTADGILYVRVLNAAWAPDLRAMQPRLLACANRGSIGPVLDLRWEGRPMLRLIG